MSRNKLLTIVLALSVSASLYACGDDDDGDGQSHAGAGGSTAGKGGSAGSGAKSGGTGKGGNGAAAGQGEAGEIGYAGAAGAGVGVGGDGAGGDGAGGTGTGGTGAGGEGGAAPPVVLTLDEACSTACDPAHSLAACSTTLSVCITACTSYPALVADFVTDAALATSLNQDYRAAISCMAQHLPDLAQYACAAAGPTVNTWSPVAATVCEDELCKWTCLDASDGGTLSVDETVYNRCNCP